MSNQGPIGFGDPNDEELPTFAGMPGDPLPTDVEESTDDAVTFIEPESAHAPSVAQPDAEAILEVRDLRMYFPVKSAGIIRRTIGHVQAVDGVSFQLPAGGSLSAWSVSPAAASRPPVVSSPVSTSRPAARSSSTARTSPRPPRAASSRCVARSR